MSRKIAAKMKSVISAAFRENVSPKATSKSSSFSKNRSTSLESAAPSARPTTALNSPTNSVSKNIIFARCFFSMPSTLSRPNSLRRRLVRKLEV